MDGDSTSAIMLLIWLVLIILPIVAFWMIFKKAGKPGWAAIIPIYNMVVLCEIVGRPAWWVVLLFIPFVNFIILIILMWDLARSFGKGVGFTIGLILLSYIFILILAFGKAAYAGAAAKK